MWNGEGKVKHVGKRSPVVLVFSSGSIEVYIAFLASVN